MNALNFISIIVCICLMVIGIYLIKKILNVIYYFANLHENGNSNISPIISLKCQKYFASIQSKIREYIETNLINENEESVKNPDFHQCILESFKRTHLLWILFLKIVSCFQPNNNLIFLHLLCLIISITISLGLIILLFDFFSNQFIIALISSLISATITIIPNIILQEYFLSKAKELYNFYKVKHNTDKSSIKRNNEVSNIQDNHPRNPSFNACNSPIQIHSVPYQGNKMNFTISENLLANFNKETINSEEDPSIINMALTLLLCFGYGFYLSILIANLISNNSISNIIVIFFYSILIDLFFLRSIASLFYALKLLKEREFYTNQILREFPYGLREEDYHDFLTLVINKEELSKSNTKIKLDNFPRLSIIEEGKNNNSCKDKQEKSNDFTFHARDIMDQNKNKAEYHSFNCQIYEVCESVLNFNNTETKLKFKTEMNTYEKANKFDFPEMNRDQNQNLDLMKDENLIRINVENQSNKFINDLNLESDQPKNIEEIDDKDSTTFNQTKQIAEFNVEKHITRNLNLHGKTSSNNNTSDVFKSQGSTQHFQETNYLKNLHQLKIEIETSEEIKKESRNKKGKENAFQSTVSDQNMNNNDNKDHKFNSKTYLRENSHNFNNDHSMILSDFLDNNDPERTDKCKSCKNQNLNLVQKSHDGRYLHHLINEREEINEEENDNDSSKGEMPKEAREQEKKINYLLRVSTISKRKDVTCELMSYLSIIRKTKKPLNSKVVAEICKLEFLLGPYLGGKNKPVIASSDEDMNIIPIKQSITPSKIARLNKIYEAYGNTQQQLTTPKNIFERVKRISTNKFNSQAFENNSELQAKFPIMNILPDLKQKSRKMKNCDEKDNKDEKIQNNKVVSKIDTLIEKQLKKNRRNFENRKIRRSSNQHV